METLSREQISAELKQISEELNARRFESKDHERAALERAQYLLSILEPDIG